MNFYSKVKSRTLTLHQYLLQPPYFLLGCINLDLRSRLYLFKGLGWTHICHVLVSPY